MQQINHQASNKSIWWWAYFALGIVVLIATIITGLRWPLRTAVLSAFDGVGLVGLWGYLRAIAIWRRGFWVAHACLVFAGAAWGIGVTLLQAIHSDALFLVPALAVAVVFVVPSWLALWRYAFRSSGIWHHVGAAA